MGKPLEQVIGNFVYKNPKNIFENQEILNRLKDSVAQDFKLGSQPYDALVLPNGNLVLVNYVDKCLTIFNRHFDLIRTIDALDDNNFGPIGITISNRGHIYILDYISDCILMTDLDFNKIRTFGSKGSQLNQFNNPKSIHCDDQFIYVADFSNKRIQVLNLNLTYNSTIPVEYRPHSVRVSDTTICVNGSYFYNKLNKNFIKREAKLNTRVSLINNCFYVYDIKETKIVCFNNNGNLIGDAAVDRFEMFLTDILDANIVCFKPNLILISKTHKLLMKLPQIN